MDSFLFSPSRFLWIWARGGWKRVRCGQRFGHFPVDDWAGNRICSRCRSWVL